MKHLIRLVTNYCKFIVELLVLQVVCGIMAILLHYFLLTSFMWMFMEGVVLYIVLVKVFIRVNWKYYASFTILSYGKTACLNGFEYKYGYVYIHT